MTDQNQIEKMSDAEINTAIAKALWWRDIKLRPHPLPNCGEVLSGRFGLKDYINAIPSFTSDYNTRPQMLAAMTREEKSKFVDFAFEELNQVGECAVDFEINLISMDQPTFCRVWLKTKGLK